MRSHSGLNEILSLSELLGWVQAKTLGVFEMLVPPAFREPGEGVSVVYPRVFCTHLQVRCDIYKFGNHATVLLAELGYFLFFLSYII